MVIPKGTKSNKMKMADECCFWSNRVAGESLGKSPLADCTLRHQYCIWYSG